MRALRPAALLACIVAFQGPWSWVIGAQARMLAIHDIQGPGSRSPWVGEIISTNGIVTGRKTNGFFLQAPDDASDADPRTSEGIFVFTGSAPAASLTPGTLVSVTGRVLEFIPTADPNSPPLTELGDTPSIEIRGAGASLPVPIEIRRQDITPTGGHEQLERLEGMRVRIASLTLVGPTLGSVTESSASGSSNGVFFGVITGTPRPFREPGIDVREMLPATAPCCVPRFDGNPERIRIDSDGQPGAAAINAPSGAILENLVGPLDYGFQSYTVLPDPVSPPRVVAAPAAPAARWWTAEEFSIASFNLQRFFDTTDDAGVSDAVLTAAAFQRRLTKASLYIRRLLYYPAIIGVQEMENLATLQALAAAINSQARADRELKPRYEAFLEEGNDPGGIDVGFLVDLARVDVLRVTQEGRADTFINQLNGRAEVLNDRPPLVLRARVIGAAQPLTVIVNHVRSLTGIESPTEGMRVRTKRAGQAEFVAALIDRLQRDNPGEAIVAIGDWNAHDFSDGYVDVVGAARGAPAPPDQVVTPTRDLLDPNLVNLTAAAGADQRYSYVFDGTAQVLEHLLVSENILGRVTAAMHVRGNADAPEVWRSDASRPERISDHDPALVYIRLR